MIFSRLNYLKQGHASNCFSSNNAESIEVRSLVLNQLPFFQARSSSIDP